MGGFEQRPWTPTKRRGPIAAEMSSPGPACVQLPQLLGKVNVAIVKASPLCSGINESAKLRVGFETGNDIVNELR